MHLDTEKSIFAPVSAPTVTHNPIFDTVLLSPAYYCHFMIGDWQELSLREDAAIVGLKFGSGIDSARNGSSGEYLSFHATSS